ncbi:MAG: acyl carrier protein [Oscillospiraceae bacterium]|jgi:acyl carrier protein|nr:acyl carrier protein [Oscillospiraceae bacterium]
MSILEKVKHTLAKQLEISPDLISAETNIIRDLGADSLDLVELVMELESVYNIIITTDEAGDLSRVGAIASFIEKKLGS